MTLSPCAYLLIAFTGYMYNLWTRASSNHSKSTTLQKEADEGHSRKESD